MYKIKLGEYEFTNDNGLITVTRNDLEWKDYIGDNAVLALLGRIEELELKLESKEEVKEIKCYSDLFNEADREKYYNKFTRNAGTDFEWGEDVGLERCYDDK